MSTGALNFKYRDSKGDESVWSLDDWKEVGLYIKATTEHGPRTFRKDRVLAYLDGGDALLKNPSPPPPPIPRKADPSHVVDIVFSCFSKADKAALTAKAKAAGFVVRSEMTKYLHFVCFGTANFAPTKHQKAMEQGVCILTELAFYRLIDTGELPD